MHSSPLLSALVVVREWLHDSAPLPMTPGATNGYWRFTRNAVLQGKRTGRLPAGLVIELDPDAVNRDGEDGKGLTPDDAVSLISCACCSKSKFYTVPRRDPCAYMRAGLAIYQSVSFLNDRGQAYDKAVLQALYAHVRAGQLEDAVDLCRKANQPWRAASIRGALLFQWGAIGMYYLTWMHYHRY